MTAEEFRDWTLYYRRRGTISVPRKLEWGFSLIATIVNNALGGTKVQKDYMPYYEDNEKEISVEDAMETWR